jgi:hypothetical protein
MLRHRIIGHGVGLRVVVARVRLGIAVHRIIRHVVGSVWRGFGVRNIRACVANLPGATVASPETGRAPYPGPAGAACRPATRALTSTATHGPRIIVGGPARASSDCGAFRRRFRLGIDGASVQHHAHRKTQPRAQNPVLDRR